MRKLSLTPLLTLPFLFLLGQEAEAQSVTYADGCSVSHPKYVGLCQFSQSLPSITINVEEDRLNSNCAVDRNCSLRDAINIINAHDGWNYSIGIIGNPKITAGNIVLNSGKTLSVYASLTNQGAKSTLSGVDSSLVVSPGSELRILGENRLEIKSFSNRYEAPILNSGVLDISNVVFDSNRMQCPNGSGILSASTSCSKPSAINSSGKLTLKNVRFSNNKSEAQSVNAATTSASNSVGAVLSWGHLVLQGSIQFENNSSSALASSVDRQGAPMGATASASAGALRLEGTLDFDGLESCSFLNNSAIANAYSSKGTVSSISRGGAVLAAYDVYHDLLNRCTLRSNAAAEGADGFGPAQYSKPQPQYIELFPPQPVSIEEDAEFNLVNAQSGRCLDVDANAQQADCNGRGAQKFKFKHNRDNLFTIRNRTSGDYDLCIGVEDRSHDNGKTFTRGTCHNGKYQLFRPTGTNDGYQFQVFDSRRCLDGRSGGNGSSVVQWGCEQAASQQWRLVRASSAPSPTPPAPTPALINTDVDYLLVSRHSQKCLDVKDWNNQDGAGLQQWDCFAGDNQRFRFTNEGNGFYSIKSKFSQRCVSAYGVSPDDGTPAVLWDCHSGPDQLLRAVPGDSGVVELRFSHSDKCLDVSGPSQDNGANVHQWQCFGSANQQWELRQAN